MNKDLPNVEFLQTTIDALKATVSKNELEMKKLKESNDMKLKRIISLEAQLEIAKTASAEHKCNEEVFKQNTSTREDISEMYSNTNVDIMKVIFLENKTNTLEQNITLLASKIETMQMLAMYNRPQETVNKLFSCELCDEEYDSKQTLKDHKYSKHSDTFKCTQCDYTANEQSLLENHMYNEHTYYANFPDIHFCEKCNFSSQFKEVVVNHTKESHAVKRKARYFYSQHNRRDNQHNQQNTRRLASPPERKSVISRTPVSQVIHYENPSDLEDKTVRGNFECNKCDKSFHYSDELALHIDFYHGATDSN